MAKQKRDDGIGAAKLNYAMKERFVELWHRNMSTVGFFFWGAFSGNKTASTKHAI